MRLGVYSRSSDMKWEFKSIEMNVVYVQAVLNTVGQVFKALFVMVWKLQELFKELIKQFN